MSEPRKKKISATEINQFTYCPYQWYYEKIYGKSELLDKNRVKSGTESAFERGRKFHDRYHTGYLIKKHVMTVLKYLILAVIGITLCYIAYVYGVGNNG